ncbi:unnamed protein product [Rangifer tarandus platyrhynchus]|uniref:Uncharacterized protein n=2 Tax=Rangifer tarandus platyrhynchus TaxID=3082113 RepID=A0AC59YGS9_RANTA|nr:unnamed protein product [Rangifer tarandus platyrhynchus]
MDLTFQVPMQHCSLQHQTLLSPPDTSTTGHCFHFASGSSFLLELFLCSSPVSVLDTYRPEGLIFQCHIFLPFRTVNGGLKARMLKWFPFLSQMDQILSVLSTMTSPSWVAFFPLYCAVLSRSVMSIFL